MKHARLFCTVTAAFGLMLSIAAPVPLRAQVIIPGRMSMPGLSVVGGTTVPTGEFSDLASAGFSLGASRNLGGRGGPAGLRVDVVYHRFGVRRVQTTQPGALTTVPFTNRYSVISGIVNAMVDVPLHAASARPYLTAGIGGYYAMTGVRIRVPCNGFECDTDYSDNVSDGYFGLNAGAGVRFLLGSRQVSLEGRYHYLFDTSVVHDCRTLSQCNRIPPGLVSIGLATPLSF
jgi:opacity protein-like surface antigen